ncbi:MAG: AI-2E family transporter [Acidimicrobiia bacterium]|nr:AI-2E family transporter [Acidimicrobiia bacterium]
MPLLTILVTVGVVGGTYLLAVLAYRIRTVLLLLLIGGFLALCLNPFVVFLQRRLRRRGLAVLVVVAVGVIVFLGLAGAFGYPLSNALAHLARRLPSEVAAAERGHGAFGGVIKHFHLQKWVSTNAPKLQQLGSSLAKPALAVGKAAVVLVGEMLAVLTLVVLLLLEGPRLRVGLLAMLSPQRAAWCERVGNEMRRAVGGYVFGDLLTSVIAGVVVGVTMAALGLPFPVLWGLWVALVDFLPQVGGALAGIPTVLFAATQSLGDAAILAGVFIAYQQLENHVLNPIIMSRTVRTSPLLIFVSVLVGGSIGAMIGGALGAFFGALFAVPTAACLQILLREAWRLTAAGDGDPAQSSTAQVDAEPQASMESSASTDGAK